MMKEYIEREAAIKEIKNREVVGSKHYNAGLRHAARVINNIPAADVRENVRGEWVYDEENECWWCSKCESSALNNYRGLSADSNYCPNCGADMRKEQTK